MPKTKKEKPSQFVRKDRRDQSNARLKRNKSVKETFESLSAEIHIRLRALFGKNGDTHRYSIRLVRNHNIYSVETTTFTVMVSTVDGLTTKIWKFWMTDTVDTCINAIAKELLGALQ